MNKMVKQTLYQIEKFKEMLNTHLNEKTRRNRKIRSFLILTYYTGMRLSEVYQRTENEFNITKTELRLKYNKSLSTKNEPKTEIIISRTLPLIEEVVDWLQNKEWTSEKNPQSRPWKITHKTASRYIENVIRKTSPNYFRSSYVKRNI